MISYQHVVTLADQLPLTDKARLIEYLSAVLRQNLEMQSAPQLSWHDFIEQTAGSLADDPIERPPQLPLEDRDPLE